MTCDIHNVTIDCADPGALARFWGEATGWPVVEEPAPGLPDSAVGLPGPACPRLYFVQVPESKTVKNRLHLDLMPNDRRQQEEIDRLLALGASMVSDRRPEVGWVILADPEGNEFCLELSRAEIDELDALESPTA